MRLVWLLLLVGCGDNLRVRGAVDAGPVNPPGDTAPADTAAGDAPTILPRRLCVTNFDDTVEVFDATQDGDGPPVHRFGPITGLSYGVGVAVDAQHGEIIVANETGSLVIFDRTADGGVAPSRTIAGNATMLYGAIAVALDEAQDTLVVLSDVGNYDTYVSEFPRTASGNVAPTRRMQVATNWHGRSLALDTVNDELLVTDEFGIRAFDRTTGTLKRGITGPTTGLTSPFGIAVDTVHDEIFVTNSDADSVAVFARTATDDVAPLRTVTAAGLGWTTGVAIDLAHDELLVSDQTSVTAFPRNADGLTVPLRALAASHVLWFGLDPSHDELVTNGSLGIATYARTATGADAPLRVISDGSTGLNMTRGLAVDPGTGDLYVTGRYTTSVPVFTRYEDGVGRPGRSIDGVPAPTGAAFDRVHGEVAVMSQGGGSSIEIYSSLASGDVAPLRTITNGTGSYSEGTLTIDPVNDEIIATHMTSVAGTIVTYARTADGAATPLRSLTLPGDNPAGLFVDTGRDELYVLDAGGTGRLTSLLVFARTATGAATPLRALDLPLFVPGFAPTPSALAVDLAHDEVFVADLSGGIRVYARTATGSDPPLRTIVGPATLLNRPNGIALCR